jgi:hypothetical protein
MQTVDFLHIGKTGGTALKAIINARMADIVAAGFQPRYHGHKSSLQKIAAAGRGIRPPSRIVFFVRDPITRFASAFYSRWRQGRPTYHVPWKPEEQIVFELFRTPGELADTLSADDKGLRTAARLAMHDIRHVSAPLKKFLGSPKAITSRARRVFFIGTQETFDEDVGALLRKFGVEQTIPPIDERRRHVAPPDEDRRISDQGMKNLREWYAADLEIYDWCLGNRSMINAGTFAGRRAKNQRMAAENRP